MSDNESTTQIEVQRITGNGEHYDFLGKHMENYRLESSAIHRKLQSKVDALRILRKELEKFRVERDQYKLMAETLQLRYSALKRNNDLSDCLALSENKSSVALILHESRERNLKLSTEVEALKQKVFELQGDIDLLRSTKNPKSVSKRQYKNDASGSDKPHSKEELQWKLERANFICHLEALKKKNAQLAFDFKALIDEKEDLITERDLYKCKAHRLNHELFVALKANETHPKFLDIDGILLENKYLHECLKNTENELNLAKDTANKYKTIIETKRKKGIMKLGNISSNDDCILSPKQVETMLEIGIVLPLKSETTQDLKVLCMTLLDNLNDKILALSHQKKTNKILATKISELEERVQNLVGLANDALGKFNYAPSQFLLSGYSPSTVDSNDKKKNSTKSTEDSGTNSSEHEDADIGDGDGHKPPPTVLSDDGMSSLSTESGRSILSSEYGIDVCLSDFINHAMDSDAIYKSSSAGTTTDSGNTRSGGGSGSGAVSAFMNNSLARERKEDLKDLPPHLAALVQKALHDLDMRDLDKVILQRGHKKGGQLQPLTTNRIVKKTGDEDEHAEEAMEYDI